MPQFHFHLTGHTKIEGDQGETYSTVKAAKGHADQAAAELGRNKTNSEILGVFVCVVDEDADEVYRTPLTNAVRYGIR